MSMSSNAISFYLCYSPDYLWQSLKSFRRQLNIILFAWISLPLSLCSCERGLIYIPLSVLHNTTVTEALRWYLVLLNEQQGFECCTGIISFFLYLLHSSCGVGASGLMLLSHYLSLNRSLTVQFTLSVLCDLIIRDKLRWVNGRWCKYPVAAKNIQSTFIHLIKRRNSLKLSQLILHCLVIPLTHLTVKRYVCSRL